MNTSTNLYNLPKEILVKIITTIQGDVEKKYDDFAKSAGYNNIDELLSNIEKNRRNINLWYKCDKCGLIDRNRVQRSNTLFSCVPYNCMECSFKYEKNKLKEDNICKSCCKIRYCDYCEYCGLCYICHRKTY